MSFRPGRAAALLFGAVLFSLCAGVLADEIHLRDGSKIVGTVLGMDELKLRVQTGSYGQLSLARSDVLRIEFGEQQPPPPATAEEPRPPIDHSLTGTEYVNRSDGFTLVVPEGWRIADELARSSEIRAAFKSARGIHFLIVTQEEGVGSLEAYRDMAEVMWKKNLKDYEKLAEEPLEVGGQKAVELQFRGNVQGIPARFVAVIVPHGDRVSRVMAWCAEPLFADSLAQFRAALRSFRVQPK